MYQPAPKGSSPGMYQPAPKIGQHAPEQWDGAEERLPNWRRLATPAPKLANATQVAAPRSKGVGMGMTPAPKRAAEALPKGGIKRPRTEEAVTIDDADWAEEAAEPRTVPPPSRGAKAAAPEPKGQAKWGSSWRRRRP
mmetsp:Transcript_38223/g.86132  ORF Transcript_38223/g.86132 Transcript_38223/m.86132 type:complete len:138 (-) Transcript_38223:58-471(-)